MSEKYDHNEIEPKWQKKWEQENLYETPDDPDPANAKYVLGMFPYPSGSGLHVGHVESFTGTDVYARFQRMQENDVLFPMGWDAFGLPAENYAIKTGTHPRERTNTAIETFRGQLDSLGLSYDWDREINTSQPDYYEWTQWLFTTLFADGLAEKKPDTVNWCPSCQTVLANAQVVDELCERCETEAEEKEMDQWFFNITEYADELVDDLDDLDWPESTKELQRNWIGRKEGARFSFPIHDGIKRRFVILHGYKSGPEKHFHPWLKDRLEAAGNEVVIPKLPNSDDPDISEQVSYVQENVELTEDTVLVGHSLGTIVAMRVLESLDHRVKKTFLIAPYTDTDFANSKKRGYEDTTEWEFDYSQIREHAGQLINLRPREDTSISDTQYQRAENELGGSWEPIKVKEPHAKGKKEPAILSYLSNQLSVFTTRPDTLHGVTYLAMAPEHELVASLLENQESGITNHEEVSQYIKEAKKKSDRQRQEAKDKTGVKLEGVTAQHPATGESLPVYVADYVLPSYGTGAIMAVPAHDERDRAFAKKHDLPIKQVVAPHVIDEVNPPEDDAEDTTRDIIHAIVSKPDTNEFLSLSWHDHDWQTFITGGVEEGEDIEEAARREVAEETGYTDVEFVQQVGPVVRADFHAAHKGVNREVKAHFMLFDLVSDEQDPIDEKEKEKHAPEWMEIESMSELSPVSELSYITRWFEEGDYAYTGEGELINSSDFNGLESEQAAEEIAKEYGHAQTTYQLQDWSIGRQRFWGAPIPIVYDPDGNPHPVPDEHLPWELPDDVDFEPTGEPPLAKSDELQRRTEEIFGEGWRPETETMDTFVDSSWYFLRYPDAENDKRFASPKALEDWCPVDMYIGGAEHAVLHLLYARFITKALADAGEVNFREPFSSLRHQGMVLAEDGTKMSKSKGNVVNPNEVVDQVGADTLRMYELFAGPFSESFDWDTDAIAGPRRFLERVWRLFRKHDPDVVAAEQPPKEDVLMHQVVRSVTQDIESFRFNTAISSLMEARNDLADRDTIASESLSVFLLLLTPFAPHAAEELWDQCGGTGFVHAQTWPRFSPESAEEETVDIAIQIDGEVRGEMTIDKTTEEAAVVAQAKCVDNVEKRLKNKTITRHIYVPQKLVNFVTDA